MVELSGLLCWFREVREVYAGTARRGWVPLDEMIEGATLWVIGKRKEKAQQLPATDGFSDTRYSASTLLHYTVLTR
jgi:hypothetical protein